jgi:serine/threonine protein kinase
MNTGKYGDVHDEEQGMLRIQEERKNEGSEAKAREFQPTKNRRFRRPLVHLDIKPANIFLTAAEEPYLAYPKPLLADFDIAREMGPATDNFPNRHVLGTQRYRAPEVQEIAMRELPITAKADVWSLGMVIKKMMYTTLGAMRYFEIMNDSLTASFQFLDGNTFTSDDVPGFDAMYSRDLHQLVTDCLQINSDKRIGYEQLRKKTKAGFARSQKRLGSIRTDSGSGDGVAEHLRLAKTDEHDPFKLSEIFPEPPRKRRRVESPVEATVSA